MAIVVGAARVSQAADEEAIGSIWAADLAKSKPTNPVP